MRSMLLALVLGIVTSTASAQLTSEQRTELFMRVDEMCRDADAKVSRYIQFKPSGGVRGIFKWVGGDLSASGTFEEYQNIEQTFGEFRTNPTICRLESLKIILPIFCGPSCAGDLGNILEDLSTSLAGLASAIQENSGTKESSVAGKSSSDAMIRKLFGVPLSEFVAQNPYARIWRKESVTPPYVGTLTVATIGRFFDDRRSTADAMALGMGFVDGQSRILNFSFDCTFSDVCSLETCAGLEHALQYLAILATNETIEFKEVWDPGPQVYSFRRGPNGDEVPADHEWQYGWESDYAAGGFKVDADFSASFRWPAEGEPTGSERRNCDGFIELVQLPGKTGHR